LGVGGSGQWGVSAALLQGGAHCALTQRKPRRGDERRGVGRHDALPGLVRAIVRLALWRQRAGSVLHGVHVGHLQRVSLVGRRVAVIARVNEEPAHGLAHHPCARRLCPHALRNVVQVQEHRQPARAAAAENNELRLAHAQLEQQIYASIKGARAAKVHLLRGVAGHGPGRVAVARTAGAVAVKEACRVGQRVRVTAHARGLARPRLVGAQRGEGALVTAELVVAPAAAAPPEAVQ
jgi:hypothetical protein